MILAYVVFIIFIILRAYQSIMVLSIIFSWIPPIRDSSFGSLTFTVSDWYLGNFRGYIVLGGIDFTPMLGIFLYEMIINLL